MLKQTTMERLLVQSSNGSYHESISWGRNRISSSHANCTIIDRHSSYSVVVPRASLGLVGSTVMGTALCQLNGYLVLMTTKPAENGKGHCPNCHGTEFKDGPHGWVWCCQCEDFAVARESLEEDCKER